MFDVAPWSMVRLECAMCDTKSRTVLGVRYAYSMDTILIKVLYLHEVLVLIQEISVDQELITIPRQTAGTGIENNGI
jgi:hypothetical protein